MNCAYKLKDSIYVHKILFLYENKQKKNIYQGICKDNKEFFYFLYANVFKVILKKQLEH